MFKTALSLVFILSLFVGLVCAEVPNPGPQPRAIDLPKGVVLSPQRTAPVYTFSRTPVSLMTSFYDYMIGGYNGLPLQVIPPSIAGGGYFLTYHGQPSATGTRRAYYAYLNSAGSVINNSTITLNNNREGYPTMAVDPVSGKPMYAWHANADTDATLEVQFVSDAFIYEIDGLFNSVQTIMNNPWTVNNTSDNEFIWPTAVVGPSPVNDKRRVFVVARNSITHASIPSENVLIAYADFNGNDLENGVPLVWSYTTIPTLNDWNVDMVNSRRPNNGIVCDNAGNLYYIGYHTASDVNSVTINEPDVDVFKCPAYGSGAWTRMTFSSNLSTWNPPASPGGTGYFKDEAGTPFTNTELNWEILNSSHLNATIDDNGKIHVPGLWGLINSDGSYYPSMQFMKELVFDTQTSSLSVKDVYPQKNPNDNFNSTFTPWDTQAPWGVVDTYNTDDLGNQYPVMAQDWDFPYWDSESHAGSMMFHCSNMKVTEGNGQGMMAVVWQNSLRAKYYNQYADPAYSAYANTPEICISVTADNGATWSDPIVLNNVDTAQFAGLKPMWVYPANKIKYVGMQGNQKVGKLGLMFYNDTTWGSYAIAATEFPNTGGQVMFTELQIVFPAASVTDPFGSPTVLSGSMSVMSGVVMNGQAASNGDVVAAYVSVNGTPQLRGKGTVVVNNGTAGCLMQIFTESNGEAVSFKVWDASTNTILNITETLASQINGIVGEWPNNLFWLHANTALQQSISLATGWNMISLNVHPADMQIVSIFAGVVANLQTVKSSEGVYIPNNPFNTLLSLSDGKGYYVKVSQACTLQVSGTAINISTPIPLAAGWNLAAFTPQAAINTSTALASVASVLVQAKGSEGVYIPNNPFNTLVSLSPGRAYWIKLTTPAPLIYPAPGRGDAQEQPPSCKVWGTPIVKTNSEVILAKLDNGAAAGDILAAFVNGELRGLATVTSVEGKLGALLQVFTDVADEPLQFKLYSQNSVEYSLAPSLLTAPGETLGDYNKGEYVSMETGEAETPVLVASLLSACPNPFKDGTALMLNVTKTTPALKLEVFNLRGQKVKTLLSGQLEPGANKLWWNGLDDNGMHVASGIYFCRLASGNHAQSIKLMIVK